MIRTIDRRETHSRDASTANLGVSAETRGARAHRLMCDHCALGVSTTRRRCVAHVLAGGQNARLLVGALVIVATAHLAALVVAYLAIQTFLVGEASKKTASIMAHLVGSTVGVEKTLLATSTTIADSRQRTITFGLADSWLAHTSPA